MTKKEREEVQEILLLGHGIESKLFQLIGSYEFQIDALKKENVQLRDSLEKVEIANAKY